MHPGAGRAVDAFRSSLCLIVVLQAAGYEGAVYSGEWDLFL